MVKRNIVGGWHLGPVRLSAARVLVQRASRAVHRAGAEPPARQAQPRAGRMSPLRRYCIPGQ